MLVCLLRWQSLDKNIEPLCNSYTPLAGEIRKFDVAF